jgi:hypothetical protein
VSYSPIKNRLRRQARNSPFSLRLSEFDGFIADIFKTSTNITSSQGGAIKEGLPFSTLLEEEDCSLPKGERFIGGFCSVVNS